MGLRGLSTPFLLAAALLAVSGCKPFSDGGVSGCGIANYSNGTTVNIAPQSTDGSGNTWSTITQSFVNTTAASVSHIDLQLITVLAPGVQSLAGQTLFLTVFADTATSFTGAASPTAPSSTPLADATVDAGVATKYAQFVTFSFGAPVALAANTPYWIALDSSLAQNATSYVAWQATTTNNFTTGFALLQSLSTGTFTALNVFGKAGSAIDFVFRTGCQ